MSAKYLTGSPWLTTTEAAAYARCSTKSIYRALDARALRSSHSGPGAHYRIHVDWLDSWLEAAA